MAPVSPGPVLRLAPFPPGRAMVLLPSSRRGAAAGVCLYAPCRRPARVVQVAARVVVGATGTMLLRPRPWDPPFEAETWVHVQNDWRSAVGHFDELAIYERPQASRPGIAGLLLRAGRAVAFVKVLRDSTDDPPFRQEHAVLAALAEHRDRSVRTPAPLASGRNGTVAWSATEALPRGVHRPETRPPLNHLDRLLSDVLADVVPRPPDAASHWRPMHGDLTPWNLRRLRGERWLVDWEDASWGPPEADATMFEASAEAIGLGRASARPREVVDFWTRTVQARSTRDHDAPFNTSLLEILRDLPNR